MGAQYKACYRPLHGHLKEFDMGSGQVISYGAPVSLDVARRVAAAAEAEAIANGWAMVMAVVDSSANLVA